ncbi:MAG: hypothetical protein QM582_11505 [Micropruina sp.]|uniref:hypothetical protein n=1 Tax=Micropruina sp. TaxID=2737536 RepID=UPI0039E3C583
MLVDRDDLVIFLSAGTVDAQGIRCRLTIILAPPGDIRLGDFFQYTEDDQEGPPTAGRMWARDPDGPLPIEVIGGHGVASDDLLRREVDLRLPWPATFPIEIGIDWPATGTHASATSCGDLEALRDRVTRQRLTFAGGAYLEHAED